MTKTIVLRKIRITVYPIASNDTPVEPVEDHLVLTNSSSQNELDGVASADPTLPRQSSSLFGEEDKEGLLTSPTPQVPLSIGDYIDRFHRRFRNMIEEIGERVLNGISVSTVRSNVREEVSCETR
jgi:hypothetical protein